MWNWLKINCSGHVHGNEGRRSPSARMWFIDVSFIVFGQQWSSTAQRNKLYTYNRQHKIIASFKVSNLKCPKTAHLQCLIVACHTWTFALFKRCLIIVINCAFVTSTWWIYPLFIHWLKGWRWQHNPFVSPHYSQACALVLSHAGT